MTGRILFRTVLLISLVLSVSASAAIYAYVDEQGVSHYTNVPGDQRFHLVRPFEDNIGSGNIPVLNSDLHNRREFHGSYDQHIRMAAMEHQIDPLLIKAIIKTESDFNQFAVSRKGAQGLMQLMPETARDLQVNDPFDAGENISAGTRYLRQLLDNYSGNLTLSLAAYNAGPTLVSRLGAVPRIPETREYIHRVLKTYNLYRNHRGTTTSINVRKLVTVN
jgi:hypothetical protein